MSEYETNLLKLAYENYLKNHDTYFEFLSKTSNELVYYTDAAERLSNSGHILAISKNIGANSIIVSDFNNWRVCYRITEKGIEKAKTICQSGK